MSRTLLTMWPVSAEVFCYHPLYIFRRIEADEGFGGEILHRRHQTDAKK